MGSFICLTNPHSEGRLCDQGVRSTDQTLIGCEGGIIAPVYAITGDRKIKGRKLIVALEGQIEGRSLSNSSNLSNASLKISRLCLLGEDEISI